MSRIKFQRQALQGWILALAALAIPTAKAQNAAPQSGRAILMAEDFRILAGIKSRDVSSETATLTAQLPGANPLHLNLSPEETRQIRARLARVEAQRLKLAETLEKKALEKKKALREGRRSLQMARMQTPGMEDAHLGRSLFESLLEEANLEAESNSALEKFDAQNRIEIAYLEQDGVRIVQTIAIGNQSVWNLRNPSGLAQR